MLSIKSKKIRNFTIFLLLFALIFNTIFYFLLSQVHATSGEEGLIIEETYDVSLNAPEFLQSKIAILVDSQSYENETLRPLINNYANILSNNLPQTQSIVITVSRDAPPHKISALLETLYREEGLEGTILIGEVPVPILDKEGVTFPSVLPYIDFDRKIWRYDEKPGEEKFVQNEFATLKEAEIWAGLIKPSVDTDSSEYNSLIALYLTKVINYHNGADSSEKKIAFLDYENRNILGEPSGTSSDFIDQTITNLLQMGRYDLNYYERYKNDVADLESCTQGFVPVTGKVIKGISKFRPTKSSTYKYLMLPLVYTPPIPIPSPPEPAITVPEVPDITPLTDLTSKISNVSKLPDPSLITDLSAAASKITELTAIDPSSLSEITTTLSSLQIPNPSKISEISNLISQIDTGGQSSIFDLQTVYAGSNPAENLANASDRIDQLSLPSKEAFDHVIAELNSNKQGDPNAELKNYQVMNNQCMDVDIGSISGFLNKLSIDIPELNLGNLGLDFLLNGALDIAGFAATLATISGSLEIPSIDASFLTNLSAALALSVTLDSLEIPDFSPSFDIGPLIGAFSVLATLPALPKMPKIKGINFTIEIPPYGMAVVLPGIPAPPIINLMKDFFLLPINLLIPPFPIPPTGIATKLKSMLKIPDFPELPEIPEIPSFSEELAFLDFLGQLPDFTILATLMQTQFMIDIGSMNFSSLIDLSELSISPEFGILASLGSIDLDGLLLSLKANLDFMKLLNGPELDNLNALLDCLENTDTSYISTDFDASKIHPDDLANLRAGISNIEFTKEAFATVSPGEVLGVGTSRDLSMLNGQTSRDLPDGGQVLGASVSNLGAKAENVMTNLDQLKQAQGNFDALGDLTAPLESLQANIDPITNLSTSLGDLGQFSQLTESITDIADIGAPVLDFQQNLSAAMPTTVTNNLDSLQKLGEFPSPDIMSLISLNVTGYSLPKLPKLPNLDKLSKMGDATGESTKTILNQDIYKNLLPPAKEAWKLLCKSDGANVDDFDKILKDSSYYNKQDVKSVDRKPGMYPESYMEDFWENLLEKPDTNKKKDDFLNGFAPGNTEILILNAKGDDPTKISFEETQIEGSEIQNPYSNVSLLYGAPYGDFTQEDYIAGHQLMKGNSLAVIAFTGLNPGNVDTPIDIGSTQEFGYGLTGQDPFLATFSEGDISLGNSLKPFWKESQIILGDPTVTLSSQQKNSDNDFSITFGETLDHFYKGSVLPVSGDFNNDGYLDILVTNEMNGEIQFLRGLALNPRKRFTNEDIIYKFELELPDLEKIDEEVPENFDMLQGEEKEGALDTLNNLTQSKITKVETGYFDNDQTLDLAIHYIVPNIPPQNKIQILINDGEANFVPTDEISYSESDVMSNSNEVLQEDVIAYQVGVNPFSTETRYKKTEGDFDNDGDIDLVFSTKKQLQFKENLSNGKNTLPSLSMPFIYKDFTNLESIKSPVDIKEINPNEGYVDIDFYPSYLKNLAGYNIYYSQDRYHFDKKRQIPVDVLQDPQKPNYRLYDLENYKRYYFFITAFNSDGEETSASEILQATPRIEEDLEKPLAGINAENEILINVLNEFDGSSSEDNARHLSYKWDFDIFTDSDGDYITSNDTDSTERRPEYFYDTIGDYTISLQVTDKNGNTAEKTHDLKVTLPKDLFLVFEDGLVLFDNDMSPNIDVTYYKIEKGQKEEDAVELMTKKTDANGFVSYAPVINVPGSKLIDDETGEILAFLNNENQLFESNLPYKVKTSFKQTEIILYKDIEKSQKMAEIFFVTDRNEDAKILDSFGNILQSDSLNTGVFVSDEIKNDKFELVFGENGSVRLIEKFEDGDKTYATILPSGGIYLDNDAYIDLDTEIKTGFVFDIKLTNEDKSLAKIFIKPTGDSMIEKASPPFDYLYPGIFISLEEGFSQEMAQDLGTGDQVFAIVKDSLGQMSPKTNRIKIREFNSTKNLEINLDSIENKSTEKGKVLGVSTSNKNHQVIPINQSDEEIFLSDFTPTFYGRVNKIKTNVELSIINIETSEKVITSEIQTDRTGNYDFLVNKKLKEGKYLFKIENPKDNKILEAQNFMIDRTPPNPPYILEFDGENTIKGVSEPFSTIIATNFNSMFNPTEVVYTDREGLFELTFSSNTHHFSLMAQDSAGNSSETKEANYKDQAILENKISNVRANINKYIQQDSEEVTSKNSELFIAIFILIIGIASFIYSRREVFFPKNSE